MLMCVFSNDNTSNKFFNFLHHCAFKMRNQYHLAHSITAHFVGVLNVQRCKKCKGKKGQAQFSFFIFGFWFFGFDFLVLV